MSRSIFIMRISFKRNEKDDYESGIIINEDDIIIDMDGKIVPIPVWDYVTQPSLFSAHIQESL